MDVTDGGASPMSAVPRGGCLLDTLESGLRRGVELTAALLVVIDIVVLFAGVVMRYAFHQPLLWSDELATMVFIWLSMLGAVLALLRSEHMRMTAVVSKVSPGTRAFLEVLAMAAALVFLLFMIGPAINYAADESFVTMPALDIPNTCSAAALPVGFILMALAAVFRMLRLGERRQILLALGLMVVVVGVAFALQPAFKMIGNANLVIFFVLGTSLGVFAGVPIAFSFGLATLGYLSLTVGTPLEVPVGRMMEGMSSLILLAVPLFVFLGQLMEMTGMAKVMVAFLSNLLGHVKGGLSYVLIGAMYLVSGISGAKAADMAAVTPVLFPEMIRRGYKPGDLVALLASTGAMSDTIPPSIFLLAMGAVTGVSIAALFTGGLMPGVVMGVMLCFVVGWRYRHQDMSQFKRATARVVMTSFVIGMPALALPFVIRAAVVEGVATATEVSTIGVVYSLVIGLLVYRQFDWKRLVPMLIDTASLSGAILLIIGAATSMAWSLTQSGFSQELALFMGGLPGGRTSFLIVTVLAFIILGSVLEGIPAIVLFGPLLFPIARQIGVHEIQYAMVVILSMGIGLFSPPFGVGYYCATAISGINPDEGIKPIVGYMAAIFVGLVLCAAIPWISIGFLD